MLAVTRIELTSASSGAIRIGAVHADAADVHAAIADVLAPLGAGRYEVKWRVAPSDGHVTRGRFSFIVVAAGKTPASSRTEEPSTVGTRSTIPERDTLDSQFGAFSAPMMPGRWLGFIALFCVIGVVTFKYVILRRFRLDSERPAPFIHIASVNAATFGMFAAVGLVVATAIKLYGESVSMHDVTLWTILFTTGWGAAWLAQMLASVIAILAFRAAHGESRAAWPIAGFAALVLAVTPALTGHAIAGDDALAAVPLDVLHVIAGSVWMGTLAAIIIVGISAAAKTPSSPNVGAIVARMINTFSPLALVCGGTVVATGVVAALLHLESVSRLWTSAYGITLIVKIGLVGVLFAVGAWNWRRVKPSLGGDEGVVALGRSARIELAVSAAVLALTAVLVAMPLPE
jgi:copper transport protein